LFLFLASLVLFGFLSFFLLLILSLSTYGCTTFIPEIKQENRLNEQEVYHVTRKCAMAFLNLPCFLMRCFTLEISFQDA